MNFRTPGQSLSEQIRYSESISRPFDPVNTMLPGKQRIQSQYNPLVARPLPVGSQLAYEEYCGDGRSASRLYPFYSAGRLQVDQESDQQAVLSRFEAFRGVQRLQRGRIDAQQVAAADRPQRDNFEPTTLQLRRRQGSAFGRQLKKMI